jgi:putative iron-regulated protein
VTRAITVVLVTAVLTACDGPSPPKQSNSPPAPRVSAATKTALLAHYAELVHATTSDALEAAQSLDRALEAFVASPSPDTLRAARAAWSAARLPYLQTEVFQLDRTINPWPIDEASIDYVVGDPAGGIVHTTNTLPQISATTLSEADRRKVPIGFHAIEFLLWGEDHYEFGPGNRPHSDYVPSDSGPGQSASRRAAYLTALGDLLTSQLAGLVADWAPDQPDNARAQFLAAPPDESLAHILTAMTTFTAFDLADERLLVAYETRSQKDELARFSDTTATEIAASTLGIQNVWLGRYRKLNGSELNGPGLRSLADESNPALSSKLTTLIAASVATSRTIPTPFDDSLRSPTDSQTLQTLILTLRELSQALAELAVRGQP